ncbi:PHP domain-containing protein [Fusibacter paucivorans]|uniref:PHP domain-containing protein n=1 Tax=Fusibacter paucivorans TaxID=76009 RepID=A0ABS5PKD2_9FIRM|nr:PHP domain-containing protein [Fusibacter paucivorans]MBS7525292.1 PHP domain-containing protein [Fusibacter paucivorans]
MKKYKFEMHFHTDESSKCGKVPAKDSVKTYMASGYDGVVVTDHFSAYEWGVPEPDRWPDICNAFLKGYRAAVESVGESKFKVILGMEIRFPGNDNDFLVYGIDEAFLYHHPWVYMLTLAAFYELAKDYQLLIVQAHPFRDGCTLADTALLHGIEVFNGNPRHDSRNELAREAAERAGVIALWGSDFHREGDFSGRYFELEELPETSAALAAIIRRQNGL